MPVDYEIEALKAQAVVARTYTLYKIKNSKDTHKYGADICDDINCCQNYYSRDEAILSWRDEEQNEKWSKIENAVVSTKNEVIKYKGELIEAFFHSHSGGETENVKNVWGGENIPYLVSVDGNEKEIYKDSTNFLKDDFISLVSEIAPNYKKDSKISILNYTGSGRVNEISLGESVVKATNLRNYIGIKSTNFRIEDSGDYITFYTVGYGHGVGMSQMGANSMAIDGKDYKEIIMHYYTGVDIQKIS